MKKLKTLEQSALTLQKKAASGAVSIGEILQVLSGKGRSLILILLCLPFCQPVQIPGLSTPFGLAIAFLGYRMAFGKTVWFPHKLLSKKIKSTSLKKVLKKTLWGIKKVHHWIYPRLTWICRHPMMKKINGLMICLLGIFLALPLPIPFSNLVAAWSIFLISLGILEDDGLLVLIGYLMTFLALTLLVSILDFFRNSIWLLNLPFLAP